MKKLILPLILLAALTVGSGKAHSQVNSNQQGNLKPKITLADYADYYLNNAGVEMWVGSQRGVSPFISLNSGNFYGSGVINYNALNIEKGRSEAQLILNGGANFDKIGAGIIGNIDITKSSYDINRNTDRPLVLNNGLGREIENSTSGINNTSNMFSFGASKTAAGTNFFGNFAQYAQISRINDKISNQYLSATFDRDSTNQSGIPIVTEVTANTNVYSDLESNVNNTRKTSFFQFGFERFWGGLLKGLVNSKFSSEIVLNSSRANQTLSGQSTTDSYGMTRVVVGQDTTDIGFNSRTTTPIYSENSTTARDAHVGLNLNFNYNVPNGEQINLNLGHMTPNQNKFGIEYTCPIVSYDKWNNQGSVLIGSLDLSKGSSRLSLGGISNVGFYDRLDDKLIYSNTKLMSDRTKRYLGQRRSLDESIIYGDDSKKVLSRNLESEYYEGVSSNNPFVAYGFDVDFKTGDVGFSGGYGDDVFSLIGKIRTDGTEITASKNYGKNRPSFSIGYGKEKKAVYATFSVGLN